MVLNRVALAWYRQEFAQTLPPGAGAAWRWRKCSCNVLGIYGDEDVSAQFVLHHHFRAAN